MKRDDVIDILKGHADEFRRVHGVKSIALFGSVARNEAKAASDVDLLVTFEHPPGFDGYRRLKFRLEAWLGEGNS